MRNKGVTLIALIISIIVLLILAGVTISILVGENGILTKATIVELEYSKAEVEEKFEMIVNDKLMEAYAAIQDDNSDISNYYNEKDLIAYFEEEYITADNNSDTVLDVLGKTQLYSVYIVNASSLSDKVDLYGKGESILEGDVFTLEVITDDEGNSTGKYELKYYNESGEEDILTTVTLYLSNNS